MLTNSYIPRAGFFFNILKELLQKGTKKARWFSQPIKNNFDDVSSDFQIGEKKLWNQYSNN